MADVRQWVEQLNDQRGRKVVFLSHCLLNENTRYLGGACRAGVFPEVVQACLDGGLGIVQMPCPEQHAWGGVLKRHLLRFFGSEGTLLYRLRNMLLPVLLWHTRRVYRKIAKQVADHIADYQSSGFTVVGIVGVDGSPSCGVCRTLDMKRSLELLGQLRPTARAEDMNGIIQVCLVEGRGIFLELLRKEIERRGLVVPFLAHDLIAELQGGAAPSAYEGGAASERWPPTQALVRYRGVAVTPIREQHYDSANYLVISLPMASHQRG
jgi:predicted secreted protein